MGRQGGIGINELSPQLQLLLMNVKSGNNGIGFMKSTTSITTNTQLVPIGKPFNTATDCLFVFKNTTHLEEGVDYTITSNSEIQSISGTWDGTTNKPIVFNFIILKAVPVNDIVLDGDVILDGSISITKMDADFAKNIQTMLTDYYNKLQIDAFITNLNNKNNSQDQTINNLNNAINSLTGRISALEQKPRLWTSATDPGTNSKIGDVWIDLNENIIKERNTATTWKAIGAVYN